MAKDNKREQILKALGALLPGRRFHEITLEEVAKAAQVGKGTIYLYFQDKDALFAEMGFFGLEQLCADLESLEMADPPLEFDAALHQAARRIADFMGNHHNWFGARSDMAAHISRLSPEIHERGCRKFDEVVARLAKLLHRGGIGADGGTAATCAQILIWMLHGRMHSLQRDPDRTPELDTLLNCFRHGVEHTNFSSTGRP